MSDVHATLIGLEGLGPVQQGRELEQLRATRHGADVLGLARHLVAALHVEPATVQFGGFVDRDYTLSSRGKRLFERSVAIDGDKVIMTGWMLDASGEPDARLDRLRREMQQFGLTHRYHASPDATDHDAYMVVGELTKRVEPSALSTVVACTREIVAAQPCRVELGSDQLMIACYDDTRLPASTTTASSLVEFASGATGYR